MIDLAPHNPYGLELATPLVAAAGSLGYGPEYARLLNLGGPATERKLGALITRTTTLQPQRARPLPRLIETPAGLLYSGVEHNPGLRYVVERYAPVWAHWHLPVIVSIAGADAAECAEAATLLEMVEGIAGIELPLDVMAIHSAAQCRALVTQVRAATPWPLLVKLPGDSQRPVALAEAAVKAGADALTLIGGVAGVAPDPVSGELVHGRVGGPAIRPQALAVLTAVAQAVEVPLVGGGGIMDAADVQAFLATGAQAVALGTALVVDAGRIDQFSV